MKKLLFFALFIGSGLIFQNSFSQEPEKKILGENEKGKSGITPNQAIKILNTIKGVSESLDRLAKSDPAKFADSDKKSISCTIIRSLFDSPDPKSNLITVAAAFTENAKAKSGLRIFAGLIPGVLPEFCPKSAEDELAELGL